MEKEEYGFEVNLEKRRNFAAIDLPRFSLEQRNRANPRFYKDVDSTINIHHMLLVIVKANLYGDNSFTTNGNFLVSNYGVKYNLLLTVNNIEILFKFKRGTAMHYFLS